MKFLSPISQILLFFSLFLFLFNKIEIEKEKKLFVLYIVLAFFSEVISIVTWYCNIRNVWLAHLYLPVEFILFFLILLRWENRYRKYWIAGGISVGAYIFIDYFFLTDFSHYAIMAMSLQNFFFFLFSARILIEITTRNFIPFYKDERFYVVAGIFIYTSLTSLMYLFYNFFQVLLPFYIVTFAGVSLNLMFTGSMLCYYRYRKILSQI